MVAKCANPNCCTPFLYLREGALFLFETNHNSEYPIESEGISIACKGLADSRISGYVAIAPPAWS